MREEEQDEGKISGSSCGSRSSIVILLLMIVVAAEVFGSRVSKEDVLNEMYELEGRMFIT